MDDKVKQSRIYVVQPGGTQEDVIVDLEAVIGIGGIFGAPAAMQVEFAIKLKRGVIFATREFEVGGVVESRAILYTVKMKLAKAWSNYYNPGGERDG